MPQKYYSNTILTVICHPSTHFPLPCNHFPPESTTENKLQSSILKWLDFFACEKVSVSFTTNIFVLRQFSNSLKQFAICDSREDRFQLTNTVVSSISFNGIVVYFYAVIHFDLIRYLILSYLFAYPSYSIFSHLFQY